MTRDEAVQRIQRVLPALRSAGVRSLALFGSIARNEAGPESDVDVLVDFEGSATFDAYMDVKECLEQALGRRVDLVTRAALKPRLKAHVERDLMHVA
jgi:predicted nucleotidyltransferase